MKSHSLFSQATQPSTSMSEPPEPDKNAHELPSLNFLPEIQTPPPDDIAAASTHSELQIPSTENTPPPDAPVLSIDTLTPPPDVEPPLSEGVVKHNGEAMFGCSLMGMRSRRFHRSNESDKTGFKALYVKY